MERPHQSRTTTRRQATDGYRTDGSGAASGGTLVATTASDGVVLAADTRTADGTAVSSEAVQKIAAVHPTAALGSTGDVGAAQSFVRAVRSEVDGYETSRGEPMDVSALGTFVAEELRSPSAPDATFVLGGVDDEGPHVFTVSAESGVTEAEYTAVGSGQQLAYGVLDAENPASGSTADARRVAGRAMESAVGRDVETGGGVHVAEVTADGVTVERHDSVDALP